MRNDDGITACWEHIPGIDREVNAYLRETFWYVEELMDRGWKILAFHPAPPAMGFVGITPEQVRIDVTARTAEAGNLACIVAEHINAIFHSDETILTELMELIRWREEHGPITRPAQGSIVSYAEVSAELNALRERFSRWV
ncbi:Uncharacterised protein [Mycobacteroides abscessus subsp. abscessus]|uniref:hypothetical protein n=1 Tax=Mycobacteroides abscessus TaxID=36809 RepID=UPI00092B1099|nr:hypothetical protein [Mycobacteroides abscessus]SIH20273.1 Uncharacterised protein [Mycobacteroides abscessus subsp. abscessus]